MLAGVASPKYLPRLLCKLYQGVCDKVAIKWAVALQRNARAPFHPIFTRFLPHPPLTPPGHIDR